MTNRLRTFGLLVALIACFSAGSVAIATQPPSATVRWHCCASENFLTYSTDPALGQQLAKRCESERERLGKQWLGDDAAKPWNKCRCVVVIHPTAAAYAAAVGRGGEQSTGCSTTRVGNSKIVYRRIDLRADRGDPLTSALPHELTHVVLADKFLDRPLPRWADEGMAILADPAHKQSGHARDAQLAAIGTARFSAGDLLQMIDYPPATRQPAFYGQSAALVKYLVSRGGHTKFVNFVELSMTKDSDQALRSIYRINGANELEHLWLRDAAEALFAQE